jgi:hypothetical protein
MALFACGETTISIDAPAPEPEPPDIDLERGLLLYLPFDETEAGATAVDASGNGHDGTPSATPPTPSPSVPPVGFPNPSCLSFDGTDELVDLGNPATLDFPGNITVSAWVRPVALDGYRNIVAHGFRYMPSAELALRIHDGVYEFTAWNAVDHRATASVPPGDVDNWHHIVGLYDGVSYRLFRDGEPLAEQAIDFAPIEVDAPWAVGGRSTTMPPEDRFFSGLIDEVRVYGRALSPDEVRALFRR